ncbi:MAG: hypothetical protein ABIH37_04905 [archaeon]
MKRGIWIVFGLLVVFIIIGLIVWIPWILLFFGETYSDVTEPSLEEMDIITQEAIETGDIDLCKTLIITRSRFNSITYPRYRCIEQVILKLNDENLCNIFLEEYDLEKYYDGCIEKIAIQKLNYDICEDILTSFKQRQDCILKIIQLSNDYKQCDDKLTDPFNKDNCFKSKADYLNDLFVCESINEDFIRDDCIQNIATKNNNFTLCPTSNEGADTCYSVIASNLLDPSLCIKIGNEKVRSNCYKSIIIELQEESICRDYPPTKEDRDLCYYELAGTYLKFLKNRDYCDSIENNEYFEQCKKYYNELYWDDGRYNN